MNQQKAVLICLLDFGVTSLEFLFQKTPQIGATSPYAHPTCGSSQYSRKCLAMYASQLCRQQIFQWISICPFNWNALFGQLHPKPNRQPSRAYHWTHPYRSIKWFVPYPFVRFHYCFKFEPIAVHARISHAHSHRACALLGDLPDGAIYQHSRDRRTSSFACCMCVPQQKARR